MNKTSFLLNPGHGTNKHGLFWAIALVSLFALLPVSAALGSDRGSGRSPMPENFLVNASGNTLETTGAKTRLAQAPVLNPPSANTEMRPEPTTPVPQNPEATAPAPESPSSEAETGTGASGEKASDETSDEVSGEAADEAGPPPSLLEQVKSQPPFDPEKTIQWTGGDCGCVDDLSGVVYGFYPYWLAGEAQELDFSLLTRIGYHALSFDQQGKIAMPRHWDPRTANFITEAQKHQTQIDLVIYKNDWEGWSQISSKDRLTLIEEITTNIVKVVDQKLSKTPELRIKALVASESSLKMGDGVTIFFDDYPEDANAVQFFIDFIETLRKKLKATGENYYLNLMLPMNAIGKGVYTYQNLEEFMNQEGTAEDDEIDLYLVLLEGPEDAAPIKDKTLAPKKVLRAQIEKEFSGIRRRNMLRKIVSVIPPNGHAIDQYQQFEDDLIYFEDNFGGVGFWPLPLMGGDETEAVNAKLESVFKKETGLGFVAQNIPVSDTRYCKFVCPNRWAFRLTYDLLFGLLAAYALIATRSALLRTLFNKYRLPFLGLAGGALLVFYSALMCDPYLSDKKGWAVLALVLGLLFYWILRTYFRMKQEEYP